MSRMKRIMKIAAIVAVFAIAAGAQQTSEKKKPAAPEMQAPKPGSEMDRMKFLIGRWNIDTEYEKTPLVPEGGKSTGWYEARLGPGGFSLIADFEASGPRGSEIGHQVITWDSKQDAYTVVTIGNNFPGAIVGTSRWEGGNLVTRSELTENGMTMHLRSVYSDIKEGSTRIEEWIQVGDSPYQLLWKANAVKK